MTITPSETLKEFNRMQEASDLAHAIADDLSEFVARFENLAGDARALLGQLSTLTGMAYNGDGSDKMTENIGSAAIEMQNIAEYLSGAARYRALFEMEIIVEKFAK